MPPRPHRPSTADASARTGQPGGDRAANRRVLIIEDEPRLREMLCRAITEMEFQPRAVPTAEAALREMEQSPAGILVVDINLPGMSGLELCEIVRARWPDTHAVILTGHGDLEAAKTAIRLDVVDFLTKPCTLGEMETALSRALRRRLDHAERETRRTVREAGLDSLAEDGTTAPASLQELERRHILAALDRHGGNRAAAAEELGISVRTIYYRLKEYGVKEPPEPPEPSEQA